MQQLPYKPSSRFFPRSGIDIRRYIHGDERTKMELVPDLVCPPVSLTTTSPQGIHLRENTPPLRVNRRHSDSHKGAGATTRRRKRKPRLHIPRQNPERQLYAKNRMLEIVPDLVWHDVITIFAHYFERAVNSWVSILTQTAIPDNIGSSDPRVINAFKFLDIARTGSDGILSRLAYIRLADVFESLKQIVAAERQNGQLLAQRSGYRNASVAVDIYIEAQEQAGTSRDEVKQRNRVARRWRTLAGPSPIFIIIYSEAAEGLAYVLFLVSHSIMLTILKQQIVDETH